MPGGDHGQAGAGANPILAAKFRIEIDGVQYVSFEKCTGLEFEYNVVEDRTGIDPLIKREVHTTRKYSDITLTKQVREGGSADNKIFWEWAEAGSKDRRNLSIVAIDEEGAEVRRFNIEEAWIKRIKANDHDASSDDELLMDEIVFSIYRGSHA